MTDRDQKAKALRYSVSRRWFPQLEVDVHPHKTVGKTVTLVTDLDVFASIPDDFNGYRTVVFDCKTKAKESPVNRALWLRGVLDRMGSEQGICILKKSAIVVDHRLLATSLGIILLAEDEFDIYARATSANYDTALGFVVSMDLWDSMFDIGKNYPPLAKVVDFVRSGYWMVDDAAEACRKTLAVLYAARAELDPEKKQHVALAVDLAALFARSLAQVSAYLFRAYLHPKDQGQLEEAVKVLLYGGRASYEHRNELYRLLQEKKNGGGVERELSLPEWPKFINLLRQLLDSPIESAKTPLIIRENAFTLLAGESESNFARSLCLESPQAGRFALLNVDYLFKAAKLPPEFIAESDNLLLPLLKK